MRTMTEEMIEEGVATDLLIEGVDELVELAKENYRGWSGLGEKDESSPESRSAYSIRAKMSAEFDSKIHYNIATKYIKVITGNSVWGFVVRTHNDKKFRYGDILKAAGWNAPARNFARGNVIDKEFRCVRWTGAM